MGMEVVYDPNTQQQVYAPQQPAYDPQQQMYNPQQQMQQQQPVQQQQYAQPPMQQQQPVQQQQQPVQQQQQQQQQYQQPVQQQPAQQQGWGQQPAQQPMQQPAQQQGWGQQPAQQGWGQQPVQQQPAQQPAPQQARGVVKLAQRGAKPMENMNLLMMDGYINNINIKYNDDGSVMRVGFLLAWQMYQYQDRQQVMNPDGTPAFKDIRFSFQAWGPLAAAMSQIPEGTPMRVWASANRWNASRQGENDNWITDFRVNKFEVW